MPILRVLTLATLSLVLLAGPGAVDVSNAAAPSSTRQKADAESQKSKVQSRLSTLQKSLKATNGYIKQSYTLKGETLDDIAKAMGVKADVLKQTMADWKKGKDAKKDAFGRADMPRDLATGPFYAIAVTPAVHHTMGGIKIDSKTQVYDQKGNVIPGLFAAGEVTGGVHGGNRLGGNAQADIVVFGRIAGQQAYIFAQQAKAADAKK